MDRKTAIAAVARLAGIPKRVVFDLVHKAEVRDDDLETLCRAVDTTTTAVFGAW